MTLSYLFFTLLLLPIATPDDAGDDPKQRSVEADGVSLTVYNYPALHPLLQRDNDTTYVVNFWATWCAPCVEELPHFDRLQEKYGDRKVKVLLVSLDFKKQLTTRLIPFLKRTEVASDVVVLDHPDANEWIHRVSPDWSGAIPATVIYRGDTRAFYEQSFTYKELEHALTSILEG